MEEPAFAGCLVRCRLIGVIVANQTEDGPTVRKDTLVAVANDAHNYHDLRTLNDVNQHLLDEIEHFFVSYNQLHFLRNVVN